MAHRPIRFMIPPLAVLIIILDLPHVLASHMSAEHRRSGGPTNVTMSQNVTVDFDEPAPSPAPHASTLGISNRLRTWLIALLPGHSSPRASSDFASSRVGRPRVPRPRTMPTSGMPDLRLSANHDVYATVGCTFGAQDEDQGYWDWTFEARLYDPSNNQIRYASNWVASTNGTSSSLSQDLTDPAEGTYTCKIDWWINSTYVGRGQATQNVSYSVPTGETTASGGWLAEDDSVHKWNVTLTGGNFVGRNVKESNASAPEDTCHYEGATPPFNPGVTSANDPWLIIADNKWNEPDNVGLGTNIASYYRTHLAAPCEFTTYQRMEINIPGAGYQSYVTNTLKAGVTVSTVWSQRAGVEAERIWP
jgi:hypothetical protein